MTKNKKSGIKKLVVFILLLLVLFIVGLASIPVIFKKDIIEIIKTESNKQLNATLDFDDLDLKLLSTFPDFSLEINQLSIKGEAPFDGVSLISIEKLLLELDLMKILFDGKYEVRKLALDQPHFHVKVLDDGNANYDIYRSSEGGQETSNEDDSSPLVFKIEEYEINEAILIYDDAYYATRLRLENLNHSGNFTMIGDKYLLETNSDAKSLDLSYDDIEYFQRSNLNIIFNGEVEFIEDDIKVVVAKNITKINQLNLALNGEFLMRENDYLFNLSIETIDQTFKSLLSVVPGVYQSEFDQLQTNGEFQFGGTFNGIYSDSLIPHFNVQMLVMDGYFKYPDFTEPVDQIQMNLSIDFPGGNDLDLLKLNLENFSLGFLNSTLKTNIYGSSLISDPFLKGALNSNIYLSDIAQVIPLNEQELGGEVFSNIIIKGNLSSIEEEKYNEFKSSGQLTIDNLIYESDLIDYSIALNSLDFEFYSDRLALNECLLKIGESDLSINGELHNYIQFILKDELIEGEFNVNSQFLDLDELYMDSFSDTSENALNNETINDSSQINNEVFDLPKNIDFSLTTNIKKAIYDSLQLKNLSGKLIIKNGVLNFNDLAMNLFKGSVKMKGDYFAISNRRAQMNFDMELNEISFDEAYLYFNPVKKYAPLVKFFNGDFTTKMNAEILFDENYNPIYNSISSNGNLKSKKVEVLDFPALDQLKDMVKEVLDNNNTIEDLNLSYHLKDGKFSIDKTPLKLKEFSASIYGSTSISQELDYTLETKLPISLINKNITNGISRVLNQSNLSEKLDEPIPLAIKIGGTVLSPKLLTNFTNQKEDVKDEIIAKGKEKVEEKIKEVKEDFIAIAQAKADEIINIAKQKSDLIRNEADKKALLIENQASAQKIIATNNMKKQVDKINKEAANQADKLVDEAKSPLAKLAAQKTADKLKKAAAEKANKIELNLINKANEAEKKAFSSAGKIRNEANNKADLIEKKSQMEAEKLIEAAKNK